jgi:hypothetical protein
MPYKIRAMVLSTGARGIRQTEPVTLTRVDGANDRWHRVLSLNRHNATIAEATAWMDAALSSDEDGDISAPKIDEYSRWCVEGRVPDVYHPLEFWSKARIKHFYLRLSWMARDLFTILAMSDSLAAATWSHHKGATCL